MVRFRGAATDAQFGEYLAAMSALRSSHGKTVVVLDAREAGDTPARQRKMQAEWLDAHRTLLERDSLGTAFVITRGLIRGVLTAILWMSPIPGGHRVFATYEEAERWAVDQLRAAGLEPGSRSP